MKIDRKIQKSIAISVLDIIEPEWKNFSKEEQQLMFNNMCKGVHKFLLREYHRRQHLVSKTPSQYGHPKKIPWSWGLRKKFWNGSYAHQRSSMDAFLILYLGCFLPPPACLISGLSVSYWLRSTSNERRHAFATHYLLFNTFCLFCWTHHYHHTERS